MNAITQPAAALADDIAEALYDASCDGDGRPRPDALAHHLAKRGSLRKRNPMLFPRSPRNVESEAYNLGCDARNDFKPIDENPFPYASRDNTDWDRGWANTDREREAGD